MTNAGRIKKDSEKPEKSIIFSIDEVRNNIKIYIDNIRSKIKDTDSAYENMIDSDVMANDEGEITQDVDNVASETEDITNNADVIEIEKNQWLINLHLALSKAEIRPYKDENFLAQIFVDSQEKKDLIDEVRKDLIQFIMQQTHYPHMRLEVINTNPEDNKIAATTPVERFRVLMQTSPEIKTLKENFKCEIKY